MVKLTAAQRQVFRDARRARKGVLRVTRISPSTVASIERGNRTHQLLTLCTLADELDMHPETARNAGLPQVADYLARMQEYKHHPASATKPVSPADLADKLRCGMAARHDNDNAARAVARDLRAGLSADEQQALGKFLRDVSSKVMFGDQG